MLSYKLEISRSRNDPKPLPISQRILGFEKKKKTDPESSKFSALSNKYYLPNETLFSDKHLSSDCVSSRKNILKGRICHEMQPSISKNEIYFSQDSNSIESHLSIIDLPDPISKTNLTFLHYSEHKDKEKNSSSSCLTEFHRKRELFKKDSRTEMRSNISHPYHKDIQLNNSKNDSIRLKSNQEANSKSENILCDESEACPESFKINHELPDSQNSPNPIPNLSSYGIYKPVSNRPTRYPRPSIIKNYSQTTDICDYKLSSSRVDNGIYSTNFQKETRNFISEKRENEIKSFNVEGNIEEKRNQISKRKTLLEAHNSNQPIKPAINNKRLPSPIQFLSNNRSKGRNRNFEPQNMDFSQLNSSNEENFITPLEISVPRRKSNNLDSIKESNQITRNAATLQLQDPSYISHRVYTDSDSKSNTTFETDEQQNVFDGNTIQQLSDIDASTNIKASKYLDPTSNISGHSQKLLSSIITPGAKNLNFSNSIGVTCTDSKGFLSKTPKNIDVSISNDVNKLTKYIQFDDQRRENFARSLQLPCIFVSNKVENYQERFCSPNCKSVEEGPISLAQRDIQAWIQNIITINKDTVTSSYLISSKILEKTSHAIAHRHALEREATQTILTANSLYFAEILKENKSLHEEFILHYISQNPIRSELYTSNEMIDGKRSLYPMFRRSLSFPCISNDFIKTKSQDYEISRNKMGSVSSKFGGSKLDIANQYSTSLKPDSCPSPPPNLPEVSMTTQIPDPPPDIPNIFREKSEMFPLTPKLIENGKRSKFSKRSKVMKPLHWKRLLVPNRKQKYEVVWKSLPKIKFMQNELIAFEELFENHTSRRSNKSNANEVIITNKPKEILSPEISRQLGIILKKIDSLHISLDEIEDMLYSGDLKRTNLTASLLESLCRLVTDEQIQNIQTFVKSNPKVELTKESKTVLFLSTVPHVNLRFKHILNMQNFDEDIEHIDRNLNIIINCCKIFRESHELKILLAIILLLGNHMNQAYDSFRDATGFNLELLPRLKETKSKDNSKTFLECVSRVYLQKFEPEIFHGSPINILPFPDTGDLLVASTTTLKELQKSLNKLGEQIIKIREDTMHLIFEGNDNSKSKLFVELVERFFHIAEKRIAKEFELWKLGFKSFQELIYYFYGEFKDVFDNADTNQFFGIWCEFATTFKEAIVKEHKNISIQKRNTCIKTCTKIAPISPTGLKFKVKYRKGFKTKSFISQTSVDLK